MEGWRRPSREEAGLIKHVAWVEWGRPGEDWQLLLLSDPHCAPLQWEVSHWEGTLLNNWFVDLIVCFIMALRNYRTLVGWLTFCVLHPLVTRATGIMMYIHLLHLYIPSAERRMYELSLALRWHVLAEPWVQASSGWMAGSSRALRCGGNVELMFDAVKSFQLTPFIWTCFNNNPDWLMNRHWCCIVSVFSFPQA